MTDSLRSDGIEAMANTIPTRAVGSATTPLQVAFIREMVLGQDARGYIANCGAIEHATPPEYAKVKCPILIIAGDEDKSAPIEGCKTIVAGLTGVEESKKKIEVLKGVGHWHCVERGEEVEKLIGEFCSGL
jgi:pimeloyl-ACP methyl ester carboxylesterase